jgi:hypothetical protein
MLARLLQSSNYLFHITSEAEAQHTTKPQKDTHVQEQTDLPHHNDPNNSNFTSLPPEIRQVILYNAVMAKWRPFYRYLTAHCSRSHMLRCATAANKQVCIVRTELEKKLRDWEGIEAFAQDLEWLKKTVLEEAAKMKHPHCAAVEPEHVHNPSEAFELPAECWGSVMVAKDVNVG